MIGLSTAEAGVLQSKAYRALRLFMGQLLRPHGLSLTGWAVLGLLDKSEGSQASALADELSVKPPLITSLLADLQKKQLIARSQSSKDSRAKLVFLTTQGEKFVCQLEGELRQQLKLFLCDIPLKDLTVYLRVLSTIAGKLEKN